MWARNRLAEVGLGLGQGKEGVLGEIGEIVLDTEDPGLIDLAAGGDLVYALSPGNGTTEAAA